MPAATVVVSVAASAESACGVGSLEQAPVIATISAKAATSSTNLHRSIQGRIEL
jgi:hypothetical protein